jgi:hypothetical protein
MKYILIIILAGYIDGGTSSSTAEFNNKAACESASLAVTQYINSGGVNAYPSRSKVLCLPKGKDSNDEASQ